MYKGTNPTALQSQQWIVDSLIELMREKPYTQITIKDICKKADLSRQTFYNMFETKEDILHFCLRREYEEQFFHISQKDIITIDEIVEAFAYILDADREMLQLMIDNHLDTIISDEIGTCISLFTGRLVKDDKEFLFYAESMLCGALSHLLVYWFQQENAISIKELTALIARFLEGKLYQKGEMDPRASLEKIDMGGNSYE